MRDLFLRLRNILFLFHCSTLLSGFILEYLTISYPKKRVFPIYPLITPKLGFFYDRWSIRHPWFWQYLWLYSQFCRPKYTLLEYHKLCSKIQDNSKFWIWIFKIKSHDLRIFKGKNYLNLNFRAINRDWRSKTKISIIENNWILTNSKSNRKKSQHIISFWHENSNLQFYHFFWKLIF